MHRSETLELVPCAACGREIAVANERGFAFGADSALCRECALGRGGRWDAVHERWEEEPRVEDLRDEES